jgi:hypothetical protein
VGVLALSSTLPALVFVSSRFDFAEEILSNADVRLGEIRRLPGGGEGPRGELKVKAPFKFRANRMRRRRGKRGYPRRQNGQIRGGQNEIL